jgi:regulator of sigma D
VPKSKSKPAAERRSSTRELVEKLVAERTEMLVLFCRLAGIEPYHAVKSNKTAEKLLQRFCQILVDYLAAGHFALYRRIVEGNERRGEFLRFAGQDYPRLEATTDAALNFNDKYDASEHALPLADLDADLDQLGARLAERIELEDKLIRTLGMR